jgi:hypothetical protein
VLKARQTGRAAEFVSLAPPLRGSDESVRRREHGGIKRPPSLSLPQGNMESS